METETSPNACGGWRNEYGRKLPIDASGKLPSGQTFKTPAQFRKLIAEQHETFTRALTEKLLTYATGRELIALDRPQIDTIQQELKKPKAGLHDLIVAVVLSKVFQTNGSAFAKAKRDTKTEVKDSAGTRVP